jgi:ribulose-phosphate 3-epimerase
MAIDIIPALLVRSKRDLEEGLERVRGAVQWVQVDLVGRNYLEGEESFPYWEEFDFEADLMVPEQARAAQAMVELGAARVVVHAAGAQSREALEALQAYRAGDFAIGVGIALRSSDAPDALREFEGLYDYAQVMGIAREGQQGQPADPRAVELVRALREAYPNLPIQVDGGVNAESIPALVEAGASRLVAGSAVFAGDNPAAAAKELARIANI